MGTKAQCPTRSANGPLDPNQLGEPPSQSLPYIKRSERRDCFCSTTCFRGAALTEQAEPGIQSLSRPAAASSLYTREPLRGPSPPARWGSRGPSSSSSGHSSSVPPGAFLLDRQAARSLFPGEKRTGGRIRFPLGKKEARPLAAKNRLGPLCGKKVLRPRHKQKSALRACADKTVI